MSRRRAFGPLLALLALTSGAGLVALVGIGLLRSLEQGRLRAELDAAQGAQVQARAMRAALDDPAVLQLVPAPGRFRMAELAIEVPEPIGWLRPEPAPPADPVVAERLRQVAHAEFVAADGAAATAELDALLAPGVLAAEERLAVVAAAAWQAHRTGATGRRDGLRAELTSTLAEARPARCGREPFAQCAASAALLHAAADGGLPEWAGALLPALPPRLAGPVLARLGEHGCEVAALRDALERNARRRALLAEVSDLLAMDSRSGVRAVGDRLLLWYPEPDTVRIGWGEGGLGDAAAIGRALADHAVSDLPPVPDLAAVTATAATPPPGAVEVVPGLLYTVPRAAAQPGLLARPAAVAAAALALTLVFLGSALLGWRALRREADALAARTEFLTVVTHELKTPLSALRLLSEMLVEGRVPPGQEAEYYALLAGESARLGMLIENVLDLGRMERGERAYDLRSCDLAQVVREAVAVLAPLARRDGLGLELREGDGAAPAAARADRGALLQALLNVLDNGRKYAAAGGRLEVHTGRRDSVLSVTVRDFGPGVPAAEREAVFERFRRGAAHRHGSVPGVGLGLHLARSIVRRHGGELVCGAPADGGPGAVFTLTLPLQPGPSP